MLLRRCIRRVYAVLKPIPLEEIYRIRAEIENFFTKHDGTCDEEALYDHFPDYPYLTGSEILYRIRNMSDIEIHHILRHYKPLYNDNAKYVHPKVEPNTLLLLEYVACTWTECENEAFIVGIRTTLDALDTNTTISPSKLYRIRTSLDRFQHPYIRRES